jgi:hypothetical protein
VRVNSYDEKALYEKVIESEHVDTFFSIAYQLAVVGWGKKEYGSVLISGVKQDVKSFFEQVGVKYKQDKNAKLKSLDITPSRLIRIFRFDIIDKLEEDNCVSFLYNKYCDKDLRCNKYTIFPGAEHLIEERGDKECLMNAYENMDLFLKTNFVEKAKRVFLARNIH